MRKYCDRLGILAGATMMLLATQPLSIASVRVNQPRSSQGRENKPTLLAQTRSRETQSPNAQTTNQEILVPNPEIIIENDSPAPNPVTNPRRLPRAIAPPVGDISVSNVNSSPDLINLGTTAIVPRLVLRDAPAREVLGILARAAGLNLVFSEAAQTGQGGTQDGGPTISLDLENQSVQEVFNSVLLISGLTANRRGSTIYVGSKLPDTARNLVSRSLRLNQVSAQNAGAFLASQGARVERLITPVRQIRDPVTQRVVETVQEPARLEPLKITDSQEGGAPLLLTGLKVSTDDRLNFVTLVGEPRAVEIASSFLTQLDARRRQVAVNVKVVDINLSNTDSYNSSFSFGTGNTFFIQDQGRGSVRFGGVTPPPGDILSNPPGLNPNLGNVTDPPAVTPNPILNAVPDIFRYPQRFLSLLQSSITNGNAKLLTDPTLVVQEGQEATVKLAQNIVTNFETEVDPDSGVRTNTAVIEEVGLILRISIDRIDDNGFVTMSVAPTVSAPGNEFPVDTAGFGNRNIINLITKRELSSGLVRLGDAQSLILSGIIQDSERETVSKIPILGDMPVIGSLFRSTERENSRAEVIVLVTPQIIDDSDRSPFGYNYNPGRDVRRQLQQRDFPTQGNPR
ncbi:MAG: hypothetical protein QNJ54_17575 [Prochloraceae cyanobacterium]|nr:hypothetical protein [Prochloraceae cyanobacterium]